MKSRYVLVAIILLGLTACNPAADKPPRYQRFVPIAADIVGGSAIREGVPWHGFFALDTKTGQLCRTTGYALQGFQGLPECIQLYQKYPD